MKTKLLALVLLAGGSLFAETRFSFGINIGGYAPGYYPPPRPVVGYWAQRPYGGAYWVAPRYEYHRYYDGYWRRDFDRHRDRDWDRDRDRDWDRDRDHR